MSSAEDQQKTYKRPTKRETPLTNADGVKLRMSLMRVVTPPKALHGENISDGNNPRLTKELLKAVGSFMRPLRGNESVVIGVKNSS